MWLSQILGAGTPYEQAQRGTVTLNTADGMETQGNANTRHLTLYAPYGYHAAVPVGEEVLLVTLADGPAAVGAKATADGLQPGEVAITSRGGASIQLKNDGSVIINRTLIINREGQIHYANPVS